MAKYAPRSSSYLFPREVTIIAHRGGAHEAPENTLSAFEKAVSRGYPIELDVRISRDDVLMVFHDERIERVTNGSGIFEERSLNELKKLDAGNYESIPTLVEALESINGRVPVIIEVKCKSWGASARKMVKRLASDVTLVGAMESVVVASFNPYVLRLVKKRMPYALRGLIISTTSLLSCKLKVAMPDILMPERLLVDQDFVNSMHEKDLRIFPWTVDHAARGGAILGYGIDALISNCPRALEEGLNLTKAAE